MAPRQHTGGIVIAKDVMVPMRDGVPLCGHLSSRTRRRARDGPDRRRSVPSAAPDRHPFKPGQTPLHGVPTLEKTLFDCYYRGAYDEFWAQDCNDFQAHFARHADVPGTFSGGWFDPFAIATTTHYASMARQNTTPQRLLMGPWTHMGLRNVLSWANDVDFGPDSVWGFPRLNPDMERWFDRWLKGVNNDVENEPPVTIFVMGGGDGRKNSDGRLNHGGRWRTENEWPLERTVYTPYFLHLDGTLGPDAPTEVDTSLSFVFDPEHPVPTAGGCVTSFFEMAPMPHLDPFWVRYAIQIALPPTSNLFAAVIVARRTAIFGEVARAGQRQTELHVARYPSHVVLPVIPR